MIVRALLAAALLGIPSASLALPCACDCDGDSTVSINELIASVNVALNGGPLDCLNPPECPRGEVCAIIATLVQCVGNALRGCPPDPTPTLVPGSATLPALLDALAPQICAGVVSSTPGGRFSVTSGDGTGEVRCSSFVGHEGWVRLTRYASAGAAITAFGAAVAGEDVSDVGGGPLRNLVTPDSRSGGTLQDWRWLRGCWIATGHAFDDTDYRFAPQPGASVYLIAESPLFADLLGGCEGHL